MTEKITVVRSALTDASTGASTDTSISELADRIINDMRTLKVRLEELERGAPVQVVSMAENAAAENINKGTATVNGEKLTDNSVPGSKLINGTVDAAKLAYNAAAENINSARSTVPVNGAKISAQSVSYDKLRMTTLTSSVSTIAPGIKSTIFTVRLTPSAVARPITVHYYSPDADTSIYDSAAQPDYPFGYHTVYKLPTGPDYQVVVNVRNSSLKPVKVVACVSYWE
ncbi:MAG: hypothetical protein LBH69_01200 [Methanomassiliicoccaceae archaeon]|jgi:hypothetical protein|nr:hypothetical protein [Methanomassiliicoccaceae archaeon]